MVRPGLLPDNPLERIAIRFYLTSSAATYTEAQLRGWLGAAGFDRPRRIKLRRLPNLALFEARRAP